MTFDDCKCHNHRLEQCSGCLDKETYRNLSFTDSAIVDRISDYFHRYSEDHTLGSFYYSMIFSNMVCDKVTTLHSSKILYIDYLFKHKRQSKILKLIHKGIVQFLTRNGKGDITRDFESMGKLQWQLV